MVDKHNTTMTVVVASACILSACAGQFIGYQLDAYRGQPVSAAIAKYGKPTSQQVIEGNKVYFWSNIRFIDGQSYSCKIWAILDKQDIATYWGYVGCAY